MCVRPGRPGNYLSFSGVPSSLWAVDHFPVYQEMWKNILWSGPHPMPPWYQQRRVRERSSYAHGESPYVTVGVAAIPSPMGRLTAVRILLWSEVTGTHYLSVNTVVMRQPTKCTGTAANH